MSAKLEEEETAALGRRLRQAAVGCTVHGHGPLNALAEIIRRDALDELDGAALCRTEAETCRRKLADVEPDSIEADRQIKVAVVLGVFARGLDRP